MEIRAVNKYNISAQKLPGERIFTDKEYRGEAGVRLGPVL
jgi:hypothetical protein